MADNLPPREGGDGLLCITVNGFDGTNIIFRIKRQTKMGKIRDAYCAKKTWEPDSVRLLLDGHRINNEETAQDLGLVDGDVRHVYHPKYINEPMIMPFI